MSHELNPPASWGLFRHLITNQLGNAPTYKQGLYYLPSKLFMKVLKKRLTIGQNTNNFFKVEIQRGLRLPLLRLEIGNQGLNQQTQHQDTRWSAKYFGIFIL